MAFSPLTTVPDHYAIMTDASWQLLLQQFESRLEGKATRFALTGASMRFNQVNNTLTMNQITTRSVTPTPTTEVTLPARWLFPVAFDLANLIGEWDEELLGNVSSPVSPLLKSHAAAYGRLIDQISINSLLNPATLSNSNTGFSPSAVPTTTTSALSNTQYIAANRVPFGGTAVASGLTIDKVRRAKFLLDKAEAPHDGRVLVLSAAELQDLLSTTEVTNNLYNSVRSLVDGSVDNFLGFEIVRTELLPVNTWTYSGAASDPSVSGATATASTAGTVASGVQSNAFRTAIAYHKDALYIAEGSKKAHMDIIPYASHSLQIRTTAALGGVRMLDNGVVGISCDTTKQ